MNVSKDMPAIEHAMENDVWEAFDCLVEADVKVDKERCNKQLLVASEKGQAVGVNSLIEAGGEVDTTDEYGSTPIFLASGKGHVEVVSRLLQSGADAKIQNKNKDTPLPTASKQRHAKVVGCLVR